MARPEHVFIAHSVEDSVFAAKLAASMARPNVTIVRDSQIDLGEAWADGVRREMEQASAVVLVIPSDTDFNRNNVWFEAGAAKALGRPVLAVAVSSGRRQALPPRFADVTIADGDAQPVGAVAATLLGALPSASDRAASADPYALLAKRTTKARVQ